MYDVVVVSLVSRKSGSHVVYLRGNGIGLKILKIA